MIKRFYFLLSILIAGIALSSCKKSEELDELTNPGNTTATRNTWVQKKSLSVLYGRQNAVGFAIGTKGYICLGESVSSVYKDLWEYDSKTDTWTQKADFGGIARERAIAFTIGAKAYVGTGSDDNSNLLKDFWEYNPETNQWMRKADLAGGARYDATAFAIGNKGYVSCGWIETIGAAKDLWEYDPVTDKWVQKADFGGNARYNATGFSIGTKGYIGTGYSYYQWKCEKDFWEYNQATNLWVKKSDFPGAGRENAVSFVINNKGYLGTGYVPDMGSNYEGNKDFWKYDPVSNTWIQVANFFSGKKINLDTEVGDRTEAAAFAIGSKGYVGTGDGYMHSLFDFWEYTPE